jgi:hypothetical protein
MRKLSAYFLKIRAISRKISAESLIYHRFFLDIILKQCDIQKLSGYYPKSGYYLVLKLLLHSHFSIDPFLTAIDILGVCTFYFNAHENLKYLDPTRQLLSSEMIEQQTQAAIDLIWAGIKA